MTKIMRSCLFYFLSFTSGKAQGISGKPVPYRDTVFSTVSVGRDLAYRDLPPNAKDRKAYLFDLYQPQAIESSSNTPRPLIIWMHGGGFKYGSKDMKGCRFWCTSFARRGYLCASINYRLTRKNVFGSFQGLAKSCYDAVEDAREAIAFFKAHYKTWNIDTSRIILGGNSAGGMIALQAAYSKPADLARLAGLDAPAQAAHTDHSANVTAPPHIAAVISFWGAIFETSWLANARTPIVSVHGGKDHIVPAGQKGEHFFGSLSIHTTADSLSIPNRLKLYEDYSHELQKHFNPFFVSKKTQRRWQEAGQFAAEFLYEQVMR